MKRRISSVLAALTFPNVAWAHPEAIARAQNCADGLLHPLTGLDHLVAAFAVGVSSAHVGGARVWLLPLTFVVAMSAGLIFGSPLASASVESMIALSLLGLGLLLAFDAKPPFALSIGIVAVAAFAHGSAHLSGGPMTESSARFAAGVVVATAALHLSGVLAARAASNWSALWRLSGAAATLFGLALLAGAVAA